MPIEIGLWKIVHSLNWSDSSLSKRDESSDALATDLSLVDLGLLWIKRQVTRAGGKFVDMLAVDAKARLT